MWVECFQILQDFRVNFVNNSTEYVWNVDLDIVIKVMSVFWNLRNIKTTKIAYLSISW